MNRQTINDHSCFELNIRIQAYVVEKSWYRIVLRVSEQGTNPLKSSRDTGSHIPKQIEEMFVTSTIIPGNIRSVIYCPTLKINHCDTVRNQLLSGKM